MLLEELYKSLAEEAADVRDIIGFNPANMNNLGVKIACMYSELLELEEALLDDDPREYQLELADVAMYAMTALQDLSADTWCLRSPAHEIGRYKTPADLTYPLRARIRTVFEYWRKGNTKDTVIALELVVKSCIELASKLEFDLGMAISAKIKTNKARSVRHGDKHQDT
jgi:hypothetical protein